MAGTATNLSNYDEVLKTYYLDGIQDYLNHATILADIVETNEKDVAGKNATIESHYGRSTGTGARGDGGALPTANYQRFKTCTVPMKYNYGRIEVTGPTIAATRDDKGAYGKALDLEVRGIVDDLKTEINRQMWGCGYGIVARWYSGTSTNCLVQKKYRGNATGGDSFGSAFGGKYLEKRGDAVLVLGTALSGSGTFTVGSTSLAVTAITTKGTNTDTLAAADSGTPACGTGTCAFFIRPSALGTITTSGGHRREMMGIRGLVTDTDVDNIVFTDVSRSNTGLSATNTDSLQGLAVASYSWFKAIVDSHTSGRYAGERALSLSLMQTMFDMVEEQAGKDYGPNIIISTRALRREYLELCQADRRVVNTMELDGGWSALDYNGVPFLVDNDAIDGEIYFLTTKDLQIYRMSDYDWMQKDGAVLSRISGYDTYEAVIYRYAEFGIKNRATQGVLTDIAYDKSSSEGYGR
jgi:hypothetical protein